MANFSDALRDKWDGISPREKRMVVVLLVAVPAILLIFLGMRISDGLDAIELRNRDLRRALIVVEDLRARGKAASTPDRADPLAAIPKEPMDLESYLNGAAEKLGLTIPSFNRQQPVRKNGFVVNSIRIDLRGLTIVQVSEFLTAIETNSKAVALTSLTLTQNFANKEQLDLKVDVSAYAHEPKVDPAAGSAEGSAS